MVQIRQNSIPFGSHPCIGAQTCFFTIDGGSSLPDTGFNNTRQASDFGHAQIGGLLISGGGHELQ